MTNPTAPLVALISATRVAVPPVEEAFAQLFPEAQLWSILDDRLQQSADEAGGLTPALASRMHRLINHATTEGADAVLLTCSMYGGAIPSLDPAPSVPIQSADEAAFEGTLRAGHSSVVLLSSSKGALEDSEARFAAAARDAGAEVVVHGVVATGAFEAARSGDVESLAQTLAAAVSDAPPTDAILLGQYSLAPAAARLAELTGCAVLAGPQRAAQSLRSALRKSQS